MISEDYSICLSIGIPTRAKPILLIQRMGRWVAR